MRRSLLDSRAHESASPNSAWVMPLLSFYIVLGGCGAGVTDGDVHPGDHAAECVVDGEPLSAISAPGRDVCFEYPPSYELATGVRLYAYERYAEAAPYFEMVVRAGRHAEPPMYWNEARMFLGRTYVHLGRHAEAEHIFLEIVRTPGDPFRWLAAGWYCGERRSMESIWPGGHPRCS